jgi:hypothetical protein
MFLAFALADGLALTETASFFEAREKDTVDSRK